MASAVMTLNDMRNFVYDSIDTDSTDLPTDLLDRYIIDGTERVESFSNEYEFRQVDYSFDTESGIQAYDVRSADRVVGITYPLRSITDARGPNWSLDPDDHRKLRARYSSSSIGTGSPRVMTLWGNSIYLWPIPDSAVTISLTGYREPIDWVSANSAADLPYDLAELVAWFALSRAYARDGDPGMAQFYRDEFFLELPRRAKRYTGALTAQPIILNGGMKTKSDFALSGWFAPLVFDWES